MIKMAEEENNIKCDYCGREIAADMVGVRWDNGVPYPCCTMCCGVGKKVIT